MLINVVDDAQWTVMSHIRANNILERGAGREEHAQYIERLHVERKYNSQISQFIAIVSIYFKSFEIY